MSFSTGDKRARIRIQNEFERLEIRSWKLPPINTMGLFAPKSVDESKISFPSEAYEQERSKNGQVGSWEVERANAIASLLDGNGVKLFWEIGAGNGNAAVPLRDLGFDIIAIEPLRSGALTLAKKGFPTFYSTLEDLALPPNSISAMGAFDVLEHLENPGDLLAEIYRVLAPGGFFICSVPAYQWLFSDFDVSIGHFKRYSKRSLQNTLESANFEIIKFAWLFGYLIVPALFLRRIPFLLGRRRPFGHLNRTNHPNTYLRGPVAKLLSLLSKVEKIIKIPVGLSILCIAIKPDINEL